MFQPSPAKVVGGIFAVIFFFSRIVVISRTFYLCAVEHEYCQTSGVAGLVERFDIEPFPDFSAI